MKYSRKLLSAVRSLINENSIPNGELYIAHTNAFLADCPEDDFLRLATCIWDEENQEIDILWDTKLLDCRFSIGLKECRWRIWIGVNHHNKEDVCYLHGIGGDYYEGPSIGDAFFESMQWYLDEIKKDKPYAD